MGGLSHIFEGEGLATTQISLIREHTEIIKPPRALWVPFDLGRPLGPPNNPSFQSKVLLAALRLLEAPRGPVLEGFSEDEPGFSEGRSTVACPVNFEAVDRDLEAPRSLGDALLDEMNQMRPWYDVALGTRKRTTADTLGLDPEAVAQFILDFLENQDRESPFSHLPLGRALNMACEDLKAYYLEAVTAQPGQPLDSASLADWFWGKTRAARIINEARERCLSSGRDDLKILGQLLLVPRNQLHRFEGD